MPVRIVLAALLALAAVPTLVVMPALAGEKRVYKVDSVIATTKNKGRSVVIQAKGAVPSGGWTKARLHLVHNDGKTMMLEFLATPPPPEMTVIEQIVPVAATAEFRTSRPVGSVQVAADANEVTTQVLH